ncbi:MAG: hypothetical protein KDK65_01000 [Chlamydiia bacterium]|nr:hypothetical protein [Chlamydiia bacterium]
MRDVSKKVLFEGTFTGEQHGLSISSEVNVPNLLRTLTDRGLIDLNRQVSAKEHCLQAFDEVIAKAAREVRVLPKELETLTCPITLEPFKDPVVDEWGHTFEREAIEKHLKSRSECPLDRKPINSLTPVLALKGLIEECQKKEPIPTFASFKGDNPNLAALYLKLAQTLTEKGKFPEAVESYAQLFQYSQDLAAYAALPSLFEEMGEEKKAHLATLHLAHYQLKAGKPEEARKTITPSNPLSILLSELNGEIDQAFSLAREKDEMELYKQLLSRHPEQTDHYAPLIEQTKNLRERKHLLKVAATHATDSAKAEELRKAASSIKLLRVKMAFGKRAWEEHFGVDVGEEPPIPEEVLAFLDAPCHPDLGSGKNSEKFLMTLIPATVKPVGGGKEEPYCIDKLGELIQKPKKGNSTEFQRYYCTAEGKKKSPSASQWVLVSRSVLENSRKETYSTQQAQVNAMGDSYRVPETLAVATSILMEHARTGKRLYGDDPCTLTRCREVSNNGCPMIVGFFSPSGLQVNDFDCADNRRELCGVGAQWKFSIFGT